MKKAILFLSVIFCFSNSFAAHFSDSTMYRGRQGKLLKYVVIPADMKSDIATITPVTLQWALFREPEKVSLNIEIYNVLYHNQLAVFSVMPSFKNTWPVWTKINLDDIKDQLLDLKDLQTIINNKITHYPAKAQTLRDNLKYWTYALLIKKADGWYCSSTDCFAEFFEVLNDSTHIKNRSYQINLSAPQLSLAEYESAYRRKHGYYSTNIKTLNGFNDDVANGDLLYRSFTDVYNGQKKYHFWLLSEWAHDGGSAERGMDRFVFEPGIGILSASYDFFMPDMIAYWNSYFNKKFGRDFDSKNIVLEVNKGVNYPPLDPYFTEYTIPAAPVSKSK